MMVAAKKKTRAARKPKTMPREGRLSDLVAEFYGDIETLGEEMRSWYDNMPEGPQNGDKGSAVDEAATALEDIQSADLPTFLEDERLIVKFTVIRGRGNSRAKRRDDACFVLEKCIDYLQGMQDGKIAEYEYALSQSELEELKSVIDELEEHKSNAESVEFPGQFG